MQKQAIEPNFADAMWLYARQARQDEISLADIWLVVRRCWLWIAAGPVVGLALAAAVILSTTPLYESRASVRIGNVPGLGLIEDPGVLSASLIDQFAKSADKKGERAARLRKRDVNVRNNILDLVAIGYSPEQTKTFLDRVVASVLERHEQLYSSATLPSRERLAALGEQIGTVSAQLEQLTRIAASLQASNPVQASLVALERSHLAASLDRLERDRLLLQQQTTPPYTNPSQVLARPALPESAVSPRKSLIAAIGILLGLVSGLLAAFLRNAFVEMGRSAIAKPERNDSSFGQRLDVSSDLNAKITPVGSPTSRTGRSSENSYPARK